MAQPRKFPQFPLASSLSGNELLLTWQGLGNRRVTLNTLKAFLGDGSGESALFVNVADFGAEGTGIIDDTIAFQTAIDSAPEGSTIIGNKGSTYLITSVTVNKRLKFDFTNSQIISSETIGLSSERGIIETTTGNFEFVFKGKITYTGSQLQASNGKVNGLMLRNDRVSIEDTEIRGTSWCGVLMTESVKQSYLLRNDCIDNGYAGAWFRGNHCQAVMGNYNSNGGYNGIDGYGIVATHGTLSTDETFIVNALSANYNMSRGIDSHSSRGSIIISSNEAIDNGAPNGKWGNNVNSTARQIHCVNRFNSCQIKDNYVKSEYPTGSLINITSEESFTFGLKLLDIQGNVCDVLNDNAVCYGISVQYKLTEKFQISNNIIKHSGVSQIYSIAIEGVPQAEGWFKDAIIFNNNCDRGLTFRSQNPHPDSVQNITFGNNTVSHVFIRLQESVGVVNLKISNVVVKERQISVYGHTNLLSNCTINNCDVDSILDTGAFEGGIYLLNINGKVSHSKVKNALAQGILATGGRVDIVNCDVIKANRGKLSASHAGIDVTGSIEECYVDNEDVTSAGTAYGYGFRISSYDMSKSFKGNRIKISSSSFARMNMSAIGLGNNVIFSTGVKLNPNDKEFRLNYELNPNGIFRFLDEVHDDNPNIIEHALKSICVSAIDRTLISTSSSDSTSVNVTSTSVFVGDKLGLLLDDETYHWATITAVVDGTNVTISPAIPTGRSASSFAYFRRWRGYGFSRTNFPFQTPMLNISGLAGSGNVLPTGLNWVNVTDGLSSNYPSNLGTSLVVKENNNRTFELFANTEGLFWMRSLHGDATDNVWKQLLTSGAQQLNDLSDVTITSPINGNFLERVGGVFVNRSPEQVRLSLFASAYSQTSDPEVLGAIWNNGGVLTFSAGPIV